MLILYRRHLKNCKHQSKGREYRSCGCPIWADGLLRGDKIRRSLKETDWNRASEIVQRWEARGSIAEDQGEDAGSITIENAAKDFVADAEARKLKERTIYKYRLLFRQLAAFCQEHGFRYLQELDTPALRKFRAGWKDSNLAALKKLERMRSFFRFAHQNGWIRENALAAVKNPKVTMRPTLPFSREDMIAIIELADRNITEVQPHGRANAQRLRALILFLRYTGLRIGDAVGCSIDRLVDGKLRLYTQKTGTHVHCPLPEFVTRELSAIPTMSAKYWFWTGNGKLQTAVADWQGRLASLFDERSLSAKKRAQHAPKQLDLPGLRIDPDSAEPKAPRVKVRDGHAHRFRDTFAVELLLAGVPLERVAILLGHHSMKITEKHYSPWVRERQEQAEADVRRTWAQDPIALLESPNRGTPEVHAENEEKRARPN